MEVGRKKRKFFTKEEKCVILADYFDKGVSMPDIAKKYDINPLTLAKWKREMSDSQPANAHHKTATLIAEIERLKTENKRLKKIVGDSLLEKEILEEANEILKKAQPNPRSKSQEK